MVYSLMILDRLGCEKPQAISIQIASLGWQSSCQNIKSLRFGSNSLLLSQNFGYKLVLQSFTSQIFIWDAVHLMVSNYLSALEFFALWPISSVLINFQYLCKRLIQIFLTIFVVVCHFRIILGHLTSLNIKMLPYFFYLFVLSGIWSLTTQVPKKLHGFSLMKDFKKTAQRL